MTARMGWEALCQAEVARFGHATARLYPFTRLRPFADDATPLVWTPHGEARVLSIGDQVDVVLELDLQNHRTIKADGGDPGPLRAMRFAVHEILPPSDPPPAWQVEATIGQSEPINHHQLKIDASRHAAIRQRPSVETLAG